MMRLRPRPLRWLVATLVTLGVVVVVVFLVLGLFRSNDVSPTNPAALEPMPVEGPSVIHAGADWHLVVEPLAGDDVIVDVFGAWGMRRIETRVVNGVVTIPGDLTEQSGHLAVTVSDGIGVGGASVVVAPRPAVDGITPLAGPRSVVADGEDWTMVTAIPVDRHGNPVEDDTIVRLHVRRPGGRIDTVETRAADLLAGVRVYSGTLAGRTTVRVAVDGATGPEVEVLEVPGPPAKVEIVEPSVPIRADGRMLVELTTVSLADRYGNQLLDGTAATISVRGPDGIGTQRAITIDGRAEFVLEAPQRPGTVEVRATVDGVESPPIVLDFRQDVDEVPVTVVRAVPAAPAITVVVGPVLTGLGGFVPDGTGVEVYGGVDVVRGETRDGLVELVVHADPRATIAVDVGGRRTEVVAP